MVSNIDGHTAVGNCTSKVKGSLFLTTNSKIFELPYTNRDHNLDRLHPS